MATLRDKDILERLLDIVDLGESEEGVNAAGLKAQVNPASLDLTLGAMVQMPKRSTVPLLYGEAARFERFPEAVRRYRVQARYEPKLMLPDGWLSIAPGESVLACTREWVRMPRDLCGQIMEKSSLARVHVNHLLAGFVDPGFEGILTLELTNEGPYPVYIAHGARIVQLRFDELTGPAEQSYRDTGHYHGWHGPLTATKQAEMKKRKAKDEDEGI